MLKYFNACEATSNIDINPLNESLLANFCTPANNITCAYTFTLRKINIIN